MKTAFNSLFIFIIALCLFSSCKQTTEQLIEKGRQQAQKNKYEEAINNYSKAVSRNKNFQLPYYYRGIVYSRSKRYKEALNDFNTVIDLQYGHSEGPIRMRFSYNKQSPFATEEAKMQASYEKTLYERALVYYYMNSIDSAHNDFTELAEANYEKGNCLLWLATFCINKGNINEACTFLTQAVYTGMSEDDRALLKSFTGKYCNAKN